MLLGIDVGGTHTDAVVIDDTGIAATYKVKTDQKNLLHSVLAVLERVREEVPAGEIERLNLSTTLTTNALVEGKLEDVGVLVSGGPGLDPADFMVCRDYHVLPGSTDHRGTVVQELDQDEVERAVRKCLDAGVRVFAAVTKFSPRNPAQENLIRDVIGNRADFVSLGHEMTGRLNFPRRIATAYFNSAVWRRFNTFCNAVTDSLDTFGMSPKVNILKADGGTIPLSIARRTPVESILSGPAASVMGLAAMCDIALDSVILDVGGTTTDMAVFVNGAPVMEYDGIHIGSHATLVRALKTHSIGVGGDSAIWFNGELRVGPQRDGPCMADGGPRPTLTDALNFLGKSAYGDLEASRRGLEELAARLGMTTQALAEQAVSVAVGRIREAVREMVDELNSRPVYTLRELLGERRIVPRKVYVVGGPAEALASELFKAFSLSVSVPRNYAVANAVGAALTRTTRGIELFADTERQQLFVPSLGFSRTVEERYGLKDAQRDATRLLLNSLRDEGVPAREENVEITHASSFNMVDGSRLIGRNIRVKCQIKPGILHRYKNLAGKLC